jgi:acetyl esterase/lipase
MRHRLQILVVIVLGLVSAGCVHTIRPPGDAPLRYRDLVFGSVTTTSNITYGTAVNQQGQSVTLLADVYRSVGDSVTSRPAVVWIHGGSFCCGSKTSPEIVDEATTFARQGYVSVSISYRLNPGGCSAGGPTSACITAIQHAQQDAKTAVAWLRTNAATYGVDPTRIAIAGTSAGAITALNVGYNNADPASAVGAAVSLSGANLLGAYGPGDAPALLFHGSADTIVPYQWAVNTRDGAQAAGLFAALVTWEGAGHVPYAANRAQILEQTANFLYWELDLKHAPQ